MSAPTIELGSEAAAALRLVQCRLHWRGLRAPIMQRPDFPELVCLLRALIADAKLSPRKIAECALVLRALQHYYLKIGADFDAARMRDMAVAVESVQGSIRYLRETRRPGS